MKNKPLLSNEQIDRVIEMVGGSNPLMQFFHNSGLNEKNVIDLMRKS